ELSLGHAGQEELLDPGRGLLEELLRHLRDDRLQERVSGPLADGDELRVLAEVGQEIVLNFLELGRGQEFIPQGREFGQVHDATSGGLMRTSWDYHCTPSLRKARLPRDQPRRSLPFVP